MQKTIFITVAESSVVRNILRTGFWDSLKNKTKDIRVVFVVNNKNVDFSEDEFSGNNILFEYVNMYPESAYERMVAFFARNAFHTGTNEIMQNRAFLSKESLVPPIFKKILGLILGNSEFFKRVVRKVELKLTTPEDIINIFNKYNPDLVFSTTLLSLFDIRILREAKKRKIKTIGMVRSWDNLTSYGFLRILPDTFFAQNKFLEEMAIKKHLMPANKIKIIGVPLYDLYFDKKLIEPRDTYFKKMGLNKDKKLILYAAIGDFLFRKEWEIAKILNDLIEDKRIIEPAQVVFRAHPAFDSPLEKMRIFKNIIPDRYRVSNNKSSVNWDIKHMINSIYHADVIVTAGSTMMIDGACFNKPVISVSFDGDSMEDFWFSVKRFHERANHIVEILKTGGVTVANNKNELSIAINRYMGNISLHASERLNIINRFAAPFDGVAGARLAGIMVDELRNTYE